MSLYVNKAREDGSVDMEEWQEIDTDDQFKAVEFYLWDVIHTFPKRVYVAKKNPVINRVPFAVMSYGIDYPRGKRKSFLVTKA